MCVRVPLAEEVEPEIECCDPADGQGGGTRCHDSSDPLPARDPRRELPDEDEAAGTAQNCNGINQQGCCHPRLDPETEKSQSLTSQGLLTRYFACRLTTA